MRVATIDIGTNTVLLLVAEQSSTGDLVPVVERAAITRLGEGVDRFRRLTPAAVARTSACLDDYATLVSASRVERIAIVGTSAMRDAEGGDALRARIRAAFGVDVRVLSGDEEARLTFRGAVSGLAVGDRCEVAVFDIGGGSTEVVIGQNTRPAPALHFAQSFDIGSVRLTERLMPSDPPTPAELDAVRRVALDAF
jgi:exopolyphosphatase/guanosine-5'-triphosphate,3'-diphosphate pyrophosphatase